MPQTNENMQGIKKGLVVVVASDCFGKGSEELGKNLMKTFMYSQSEADVRPQTMLFLNDGVMLTSKGSAVLEHLLALESAGTEIYTCGACLDYYKIQDALAVGKVTNMYSVVEMMNEAESVINL